VVEARGPAEAAGVEAGDELISVDGQPIKHDVDFYIHLLRIRPSDRLVLELRRNDRPVTATIQPRPIPIPDGGKLLREKFGVTARVLAPAEASELDLKGGLIITQVEPGSPARQAGFEPGLIVVQIGQSFPTDLGEVGSLLEHVRPGDRVAFRLWRIQQDFIRVYAVVLTAR
jgi:serine protease Do